MNEKPPVQLTALNALALADKLDSYAPDEKGYLLNEASAELRRLHGLTEPQEKIWGQWQACITPLVAHRDELQAKVNALEKAAKENIDFDKWWDHPYTKLMEKSISEDYVPREGHAPANPMDVVKASVSASVTSATSSSSMESR